MAEPERPERRRRRPAVQVEHPCLLLHTDHRTIAVHALSVRDEKSDVTEKPLAAIAYGPETQPASMRIIRLNLRSNIPAKDKHLDSQYPLALLPAQAESRQLKALRRVYWRQVQQLHRPLRAICLFERSSP